MIREKFRKTALLIALAAGLTAAVPLTAEAGVIARGRSVSGTSTSDQGTDISSKAVHDTEAPAALRTFGYTEADAQAAAERLYSFETNALKKEIDMSYLMHSIWYDPDNLYTVEGKYMLRLYAGSPANYHRAYLEALDGLEFFSSPTCAFLTEKSGGLLVGVELPERFTEQEAAENYKTLLVMLDTIDQVKAAAAGKDDADKAKYICDYAASHLTYDTTYQKNCLADALRSGVTACMGYNNLTGLLFEHCGLPYISVVAQDKNDTSIGHIFGLAKIVSTWLVFDPTNYDRDSSVSEPYWIFSDSFREGKYYTDFRLVEEPDSGSDPQVK